LHTHNPPYEITSGAEPDLRPRGRKKLNVVDPKYTKRVFDADDPIAALKAGLHTVRHHRAGWLKEDLVAAGRLMDTKDAIHSKIWADYNAQLIHIRAQQDIMGPDYNPLRCMPPRDADGQFAFTKRVDVPKNYLSLTYLLHAYDVNMSTFKRLRQRQGEPLQKQVPHNKGRKVLCDNDLAETVYTPRYFYVMAEMKTWMKSNPQASARRKADRRKWLRQNWDLEKEKDGEFGKGYDKKSRDHIARQKGAKEELVSLLAQNGRRSYSALGKAMNMWCSISTIERFFKSQKDFQYYSQNVRPLLSEGNRQKQVAFAQHVHNRWGLGPGNKILWTMRSSI
jgi:hypothetical protein